MWHKKERTKFLAKEKYVSPDNDSKDMLLI